MQSGWAAWIEKEQEVRDLLDSVSGCQRGLPLWQSLSPMKIRSGAPPSGSLSQVLKEELGCATRRILLRQGGIRRSHRALSSG